MEQEYKIDDYEVFLDNCFQQFSVKIDKLVESNFFENEKYINIFEIYSEENKNILDEIIETLFVVDIDLSELNDMVDRGIITPGKFNKDLNDEMFNLLNYKLFYYKKLDKDCFYNSKFMDMLRYLQGFFKHNYFEFVDSKIQMRNLEVLPENCCELANKLCDPGYINYDAIMDKNGKIYLAVSSHDELMEYLFANSIDVREGVRIAMDYVNTDCFFDLSSLFKYVTYPSKLYPRKVICFAF